MGNICALNVHTRQNDDSSVVVPVKTPYFERGEDGSYTCTECEYKTVALSNLKNHILAIHEGVKFKCDQCSREFTSKSNLQAHIRSKHEEKKYNCMQCAMQFTSSNRLSEHIINICKKKNKQ